MPRRAETAEQAASRETRLRLSWEPRGEVGVAGFHEVGHRVVGFWMSFEGAANRAWDVGRELRILKLFEELEGSSCHQLFLYSFNRWLSTYLAFR